MHRRIKIKEKAKKAKIQNIVEMALSFSGMGRVFEKESTKEILMRLGNCIEEFFNVKTKEEYHKKHREFCKWFTNNIKTAERKKEGRIIKESQYASWGHASKVIDIFLKVCIYYCNLPSSEVSSKIIPWLNGAVDTKILKYLKKQYNSTIISKDSTIKDIDKEKYDELQKMISIDIKNFFEGEISSVQWDDIRFREFNR